MNNYDSINERIATNVAPLQELVNSIVAEHCRALDEYMKQVDNALCAPKKPTTTMLEDMLLNINSLLYWVGDGLEVTTLRESMAKMVKEERYNKAYNDTTGTMGDKTATAKLASQEEELTRVCYTNAVKLYQHKIDCATEMASSLKKVLSHRISEMELSRMVVN